METKRETEKVVTIGDRKFKIKKMDARLASYVAYQVKSLLPSSNDAGDMVSAGQSGLSRQQFFALQNDCLSVCFHVMPAGDAPVIDGKGNFIDVTLEFDAKTIMLLTVQSLAFNVTSFFDESFLSEFSGTVQGMIPSHV
jgi:hypothetical protein